MLVVQIITGVVLAMHYVAARRLRLRFGRAHHARRELRLACIRYMHANGASMFFLAVYIHMFRGLYYGSYKAPREVLWIIGVLIYPADDGHGLHRLCAALGPDELLGRQGDHQPVLGHSVRRRRDRDLAVGRLFGRRSDPEPLLLAALPAAIRARRPGRSCISGRCMCRATTTRSASMSRPGRTRCPSTPITR